MVDALALGDVDEAELLDEESSSRSPQKRRIFASVPRSPVAEMEPATRTLSPRKTDSGARASATARSLGGRVPPTTTVWIGMPAPPMRRETASTPASPVWRPSVTTRNPASSSNGMSRSAVSSARVRSVDERNAVSRAASSVSATSSARGAVSARSSSASSAASASSSAFAALSAPASFAFSAFCAAFAAPVAARTRSASGSAVAPKR